MLEKVKGSLRIDGPEHDDELTGLIETAKALLKEAGVTQTKVNDDTDPLIRKAVITYCKAEFGTDEKAGEKFAWSFEEMKKLLSLLATYTTEPVL
ncbi:putative phage protein (predicted DNA packaging) [Lysinibacillus composti]|uniref:DNA-packaging protein n=1 Tax=Lysinibacillus composti TaxID=720633 RepID=A0A3N9UIZ0_9BACI|nr:head-tail connector protein [Lysinibacillus composti]MBM7607570.1 putative phage protein (predicted DNA packaging) [Lysinibacillus composti]RQW75925.1 DNA-packaging protein [Lysinibacillus composti]